MTSRGWSVSSTAQSRNVDRKPWATAGMFQSLRIGVSVVPSSCLPGGRGTPAGCRRCRASARRRGSRWTGRTAARGARRASSCEQRGRSKRRPSCPSRTTAPHAPRRNARPLHASRDASTASTMPTRPLADCEQGPLEPRTSAAAGRPEVVVDRDSMGGGVVHLEEDVRDPRLEHPPVEVGDQVSGPVRHGGFRPLDAEHAVFDALAGDRTGPRRGGQPAQALVEGEPALGKLVVRADRDR